MKKLNLSAFGLVAGALALLAPVALHAQSINYSEGDLLLGFESYSNGSATGQDYIVDLGPASYFIGLTQNDAPGTTVNITTTDPAHDGYSQVGLGNIAADLSGTFGSTWYATNAQGSNVQWGVIGATDTFAGGTTGLQHGGGTFGLPASTLFLTIPETTPGSGSTAPSTEASGGQTLWDDAVKNFANPQQDWDDAPTTANSPSYAAFEPAGSTDSWSAEINNDTSSDAFATSFNIEQPTSGTFIGPTNSELDLYELIPTGDTGNTTGKGTELGSFTLDSSGDLDFTTAGAVPEPSTYAAIGAGAILLLISRRSRRPYFG